MLLINYGQISVEIVLDGSVFVWVRFQLLKGFSGRFFFFKSSVFINVRTFWTIARLYRPHTFKIMGILYEFETQKSIQSITAVSGWIKNRPIYRQGVRFRRPPLWSSGQSSWLQILRSRLRFPALPDFLRSSGSGTGSTQPREDNWGATWMQK
jgi:hypothetical protein